LAARHAVTSITLDSPLQCYCQLEFHREHITDMTNDFKPIELLRLTPEGRLDLSKPKKPVYSPDKIASFARSRSAPVAPAKRREVPEIFLTLQPRPVSAYDDNPVFNEINAARLIGVTADCLKKWRQRKQGPDYIQYGTNGPIRYELNALIDFRNKHRITLNSGK
jgi:hypothetical protein